ncbi:MAG TPA: hypothetical protein VNK52_09165 [Hyphomicrobiaceae bacterium]|nr:hypothetical protein [Hyphomicrobiaceae bacterium]
MIKGDRWRLLSTVLDQAALLPLLAVLYPTIFALSNNWYSIGGSKILWLLGASVVAGLLILLLVEVVVALLRLVLTAAGAAGAHTWAARTRAVLLSLASIAALFILLDGTLTKALRSELAVAAALVLCIVSVIWLLLRGGQKYVNGLLATLILVSGFSWLWSWGEVKLLAPASARFLAERAPFELARFVSKPNIYLFIYDAYGSRDVYGKLFKFDNSAHYRALEERRFKIAHTFANYYATWPTTLGVFIGAHHYYRMSEGVDDTKLGRSIMAGLARNPVLDTLRDNGYRVQYIHGIDYFVSEQGALDYLFPQEPLYAALRIYGSPLFNSIAGDRQVFAGRRSVEEQTAALFSRLPDRPNGKSPPWFTFAHVALPSHGPTSKTWLDLAYFEREFVELTIKANAHSLEVIDRIRAKDPDAIIVIIGDHGAWRYRKVWTLDRDPNRAFERAGLSQEIIALDLFGTMIAVYSNGRCDDYIYPSLTPVNLMRAIFACLAGDRRLLESRPEDISIFPLGRELLLVARDGQALPRWEKMERRVTTAPDL